MSQLTRIICVCGATATGKSDLAVELAQKLDAEIISFDSLQIYKRLDIGTAKPSVEIRNSIRHHLIDEIEPSELFTAGGFRNRAIEILETLNHRPHTILVGGTGFYLQALLRGMFQIPHVPHEIKSNLQIEAKNLGWDEMYHKLSKLDPDYASKIHRNDRYRIQRALELLSSGAKSIRDLQENFKEEPLPNPVTMIGLRKLRADLLADIQTRTSKMIENGLTEETKKVLAEFGPVKPLDSVGYKEAKLFLNQEINHEELQDLIVKNTMALAKRQSTWFKRNEGIFWFDGRESLKTLKEACLKAISSPILSK